MKGVSGAVDFVADATEAWANNDPNKAAHASVNVIVDVTTGKLLPKGTTDAVKEGIGQALNEMAGDVAEMTVDEYIAPTKQ